MTGDDFIIEVVGALEAQDALVQALEAVSPFGALGRAAKEATLFVQRYAKGITHVWTGMLQASHIIEFSSGHMISFTGIPFGESAVGRIYINPMTRNPVHGIPPAEYGLVEHERGGSHAFYKRTYEEAGPIALLLAASIIHDALPGGFPLR